MVAIAFVSTLSATRLVPVKPTLIDAFATDAQMYPVFFTQASGERPLTTLESVTATVVLSAKIGSAENQTDKNNTINIFLNIFLSPFS